MTKDQDKPDAAAKEVAAMAEDDEERMERNAWTDLLVKALDEAEKQGLQRDRATDRLRENGDLALARAQHRCGAPDKLVLIILRRGLFGND